MTGGNFLSSVFFGKIFTDGKIATVQAARKKYRLLIEREQPGVRARRQRRDFQKGWRNEA